MSVILIEKQVVHYEVLGRGRPIILLHGWVGSWRYWIPVMQAASVSYRAYAVDFWGFGDTAKFQPFYSLNSQVNLIDHFLYDMGIERVALVGHGLGAVAAIQLALRYPRMIDRVMAVSCPLNDTFINPRLRSLSPLELADWLIGKTPLTDPVRIEAPKTDSQAILTSLLGLNSPEVIEATTRLTTPCLFVNGLNDQVIIPPEYDKAVSLPIQAHAIFFEQSGHFPMLDEGSKFNRLMFDFLSLPSGDSPRELQLKEEWKRRVR